MRITTLETYFLTCPLSQPVSTSTSTISQVSEVIVRLNTDAGLNAKIVPTVTIDYVW